jgi:hypothetical protein
VLGRVGELSARGRDRSSEVISHGSSLLSIEFVRPTTPVADDALIDAAGRTRPVVFATSVIDRPGGPEILGGPVVRRQVGAQVGATAALPDSRTPRGRQRPRRTVRLWPACSFTVRRCTWSRTVTVPCVTRTSELAQMSSVNHVVPCTDVLTY